MAGVKSVERAIALLSQVAHRPGGLVDLADATGLPTSTTARLLATLEGLDAVRRDDAGVYRIGPTVAVLGVTEAGEPSLRDIAFPHLEELATTLDEAVGLSVLAGEQSVTIAQVDIPRPVQAQNWEGTRWPLHQGASGHALVATWDPEDIAAFLKAHPDAPGLAEHIASPPASGVWWSVGDYVEGLTSAAAPILDGRGYGVGTLYAYGPSYRFPSEETTGLIEESLLDRAARISRAWIARNPGPSRPGRAAMGAPLQNGS
ncbi:MAG TPA: IclR family transcriptional regulator [Nocardioidaceae bacterium]|nr:IclR family transcriptional regulator [Nocardioidaceae bacterium]